MALPRLILAITFARAEGWRAAAGDGLRVMPPRQMQHTLAADDGVPAAAVATKDVAWVKRCYPTQTSAAGRPRCVVFDLDGCLWTPEMYQLSGVGGGPPFTPSDDGALGPVTLLADVREVMRELHVAPEWRGTKVAISSRCDEPDWAAELLDNFRIDDDTGGTFALREVFDPSLIEICPDDKRDQFERLSERSGIPLEEMVFFDNEPGNVRSVARMGVTCVYSPEGVTNDAWRLALDEFPASEGEALGW